MKKQIKTQKPISRTTAELSLQRALQFLRTIGTDSSVRAAMQDTGFTGDDMKQGWQLVLNACSAPIVDVTTSSTGGPSLEASNELASWASTMLPRALAALSRLHPDQASYVFEFISSANAPVVNVSLFLARCQSLENGADRKATRKADHAALETLTKRGITEAQRKHAKHLVGVVETPAPVADVVDAPTDARTAALTQLHAWVQDWSDCARTVIARRDQLIRLGIGKRRARGSSSQPVEPVTPPPAPPVVTAPTLPVAPTTTAPVDSSTTPVLIESAPMRALPAATRNGVNGAATHA